MIDSRELGWTDTTGEILSALFSTSGQKISKASIARRVGLIEDGCNIYQVINEIYKTIAGCTILWKSGDINFFKDRRNAMNGKNYNEPEWLTERGYGDVYTSVGIFASIDGMSTRLYNVLLYHQILDYREFAEYTEEEVLKLSRMGTSLFYELKGILKRKGINFKGE